MSDRFEGIADEYEQWKSIDPDYDPVQRRVVELLALHLKQDDCHSLYPSIAEIGCGTGYTTKMILGSISPKSKVVAIDNSQPMVERAREELAGSDRRLEVLLRDVCHLDEGGEPGTIFGYYSFIVSVMTFHNISPENRLGACKEIRDHMRPCGLFITGDQLPPDDKEEGDRLYQKWLDAIEIFKDRGLDRSYEFWRAHTIEDSGRRLTEGAQVKMLEEAGFVDIQLHERFGMYRIISARNRK